MKRRRLRRWILTSTAFLVALYPAVLSFRATGITCCFSWFAADAFYYLAVAKHTAWAPLFSFDTLHPTNGSAPLERPVPQAKGTLSRV